MIAAFLLLAAASVLGPLRAGAGPMSLYENPESSLGDSRSVAFSADIPHGESVPRSFFGLPLSFQSIARAMRAVDLVQFAVSLKNDKAFATIRSIPVPCEVDFGRTQRFGWGGVLSNNIGFAVKFLNVRRLMVHSSTLSQPAPARSGASTDAAANPKEAA